jgi:hypothetical protein
MKSEYVTELKMGICEITYLNTHSVEQCDCLTVSPTHVTKLEPKCHLNTNDRSIVAWNVREERWQKIPVYQIVEFERLTGEGIQDESKILSGTYLNTP